jgi:hypothetical protein
MNKLVFLFGVSLVIIGIVFGVQDSMEAEYKRGYKAGADSLSDKHVDQVCIQWLFHSDLVAAKKRVCGKGN